MDERSKRTVESVQSPVKTIFAIISLATAAHAAEPDAAVKIDHVVEGIYFQTNGFQTTILELKDGRYRFWFSNNDKIIGDLTKYPLTGPYTTNGGQVTFVSTNTYSMQMFDQKSQQTNQVLQTNVWTFRAYKGEPTLWRPDGITHWQPTKRMSSYAMLQPTQRKPEEIWRGN